MTSFVDGLREELVAAAAREQARSGPRLHLPRLRPLVIATAGLALAAIVVIALAGGLRGNPAPVEHTAKPPAPKGRPMFDGTLTPGVRYRTRAFVPALSFVVADDRWYVTETDATDSLVLQRVRRGGPEPLGPRSTLLFGHMREVYDPAVRRPAARMKAPLDLHAWLREHPDLRVGAASPVTVAGVSGTSFPFEARFTRPAHRDPFCREHFRRTCTFIAPDLSLLNGMRLRLIVLRTGPEPLLILTVATAPAKLADVNRVAAPVLDSLRIGIR
jgi:hypothetical protein